MKRPRQNSEPEYTCALPTDTPEAEAALVGVKTIAIVGLSPKEERPSNQIGDYLLSQGYDIIPIRPATDEVLGIKAYPSLKAYGKPVDLINIFRRPEAVPEIVDQAIALKCKVIWMQEGISHSGAAAKAETAGLSVVQNKCIYVVHKNLP
jgi:uncharacterized protein